MTLFKSQLRLGMAVVLGVGVGGLATGCGKNGQFALVKDVKFETSQVQNDSYGTVRILLDTGAITLPSLTLPIFDPNSPSTTLGGIGIAPTFQTGQTGTEIKLDFDLTNIMALAGVPGVSAELPNHTTLPVGGVDLTKIVALAVPGTLTRVYLGASPGMAIAGAAIAIRELDGLGSSVGSTTLFAPFDLGKGVRGVVGVFTGRGTGQSGLGVFVDASALFPVHTSAQGLLASGSVAGLHAAASVSSSRVRFLATHPSERKERRIRSELIGLHLRRARVELR